MDEEYDDLPEVDALLRAEKKHEWISEPRFKRMFNEIEDGLQGVLGKGKFEWVDRRVFDQVFDRSTLLAVHKLMQKGQIETIDYPIARGKEAHVFHASTNPWTSGGQNLPYHQRRVQGAGQVHRR